MAMTDSTGSTWRYRWAHRHNSRRQRAFRAADEAWRHRDEELRRLRTLAGSFHGSTEAGAGLPIELAPGEVVFWTLPAAQLVEVRHTAVLPAPELTVDPEPPVLRPRRPEGVKVVDAGLAVLTNRRLVLLGGRGRRDWTYGRMTGLSHDPAAPVTLIQVLDRRRTSGLLLPTGAVADFRFKLTLAFADAIEQRAAVVAQLDELIAEHEAERPERPAVLTPAQARLSGLLPGGRRTVAVALALALIVPAMLFESDPPVRPGSDRAAAATPDATATPAATAAPAPPPIAPAVQVKPRPEPQHSRPTPPTRSTTPRPAAERRCGAPANPYGYDFCGGSRIRKPDRGVCDWFDCVPGFWSGRGWLVQCRDGTVSLTGGRRDACAGNQGFRRTFWA
ncbi:hypothetical protein GCE86_30890 [Micromonospora terminaliae]|uniref:Uncharacterized protein n=1 Tax=Micromonospora terminaliae TaxID=1914461 RepID=A0AAJ3DLC1_9ACTN|nr:hypothetical protein [Micromonospora terminaliae]NES30767.1 hypothetical protein [Micromonospora terminaliae]QGL51057.1 hypothetical protein GCE86_30890 [Micromonospora terminaliae]